MIGKVEVKKEVLVELDARIGQRVMTRVDGGGKRVGGWAGFL